MTKSESVELLPCPFCASPARLARLLNKDDGTYVICPNMDCLVEGPVGDDTAQAITLWNTRTQEKQS